MRLFKSWPSLAIAVHPLYYNNIYEYTTAYMSMKTLSIDHTTTQAVLGSVILLITIIASVLTIARKAPELWKAAVKYWKDHKSCRQSYLRLRKPQVSDRPVPQYFGDSWYDLESCHSCQRDIRTAQSSSPITPSPVWRPGRPLFLTWDFMSQRYQSPPLYELSNVQKPYPALVRPTQPHRGTSQVQAIAQIHHQKSATVS